MADLRQFLAYTLDLAGLPDTSEHAWRPTAAASVTFAAVPEGWRILADDGQGGRFTGLLPLRDGTAGSPVRRMARRWPGPTSSTSAAAPRAATGSAPGATGASMNPWACSAPWRCCGHRRADCW